MDAPASFQDVDSIRQLLNALKDLGVTHLDTAARYPPNNPGLSERLLGEAGAGDFVVDTKILTDTRTDGSGDLAFEAMNKSVGNSLKSLKRANVSIAHVRRKSLLSLGSALKNLGHTSTP